MNIIPATEPMWLVELSKESGATEIDMRRFRIVGWRVDARGHNSSVPLAPMPVALGLQVNAVFGTTTDTLDLVELPDGTYMVVGIVPRVYDTLDAAIKGEFGYEAVVAPTSSSRGRGDKKTSRTGRNDRERSSRRGSTGRAKAA